MSSSAVRGTPGLAWTVCFEGQKCSTLHWATVPCDIVRARVWVDKIPVSGIYNEQFFPKNLF